MSDKMHAFSFSPMKFHDFPCTWAEYNGLDFAVAMRSCRFPDFTPYYQDESDPHGELAETHAKVAALKRAVEG